MVLERPLGQVSATHSLTGRGAGKEREHTTGSSRPRVAGRGSSCTVLLPGLTLGRSTADSVGPFKFGRYRGALCLLGGWWRRASGGACAQCRGR